MKGVKKKKIVQKKLFKKGIQIISQKTIVKAVDG